VSGADNSSWAVGSMSLLGIFNSLGYCGKFGHLADEITNSLRALQRLLVLFLQVTLDLVSLHTTMWYSAKCSKYRFSTPRADILVNSFSIRQCCIRFSYRCVIEVRVCLVLSKPNKPRGFVKILTALQPLLHCSPLQAVVSISKTVKYSQ
jgi:hypothetical protein